eukprot:scaffold92022_cov73-Phaeocystis_antarctica.AAC.1
MPTVLQSNRVSRLTAPSVRALRTRMSASKDVEDVAVSRMSRRRARGGPHTSQIFACSTDTASRIRHGPCSRWPESQRTSQICHSTLTRPQTPRMLSSLRHQTARSRVARTGQAQDGRLCSMLSRCPWCSSIYARSCSSQPSCPFRGARLSSSPSAHALLQQLLFRLQNGVHGPLLCIQPLPALFAAAPHAPA